MGTQIIRQARIQHPVVEPCVLLQWPLEDLFPRHSELRAARYSNHFRYVGVVEQFRPCLCVHTLRCLSELRGVSEGTNLIGTAGRLLAPEVDVAVSLDEVGL